MDYTSRYGLDFNPFIKNSKEIIIATNEYKEITYRLNALLKTRGFGLMTGAPGKGKTTIVRNWANSLNASQYKVIYSPLSTTTVVEFYKNLAEQLGLMAVTRKSENFKMIQSEIIRYAVEKRITPIIIIDEANYVSNAILNDLKMLFNFEMDSKDRAIILLVGLPRLNNTLRLSSHEPLRQRITMNYHLDGLSKEEAKTYITEKLKGANCYNNVFSESALEAIINTANGIPRIINKLCNASLMIGHSKEVSEINNDVVLMAINETELG